MAPGAYPVGSACARCGVGMPSGSSQSWAGRSSRAPGGVSGPVRVRRGVSALPHGLPLAARVPLPDVRRRRQLPFGGPRPAAVPGVPAPDLGDGWHRPGPHPAALAALVRRRLPRHHPHAGVLGAAVAAPARARPLRDGLDDAAEAAAGDGATGSVALADCKRAPARSPSLRQRGRRPGGRRPAGPACRSQARHAPVPWPASPWPRRRRGFAARSRSSESRASALFGA